MYFTIIQQPRGGGSFSKGVLCLKGQELASVWEQRTGRKVTLDSAVQWLQFWMLDCFYYNLEKKANKLPKYCKTFDSP